MADNTQINLGTTGDTMTSFEFSFSGDTAKAQGVGLFGLSGSEGSWTANVINGSTANGLEVDVTRVQGTVTVDASGTTVPVDGSGVTQPISVDAQTLNLKVVGAAAENAAASGNPVLLAGRYDAINRTLDDGDAGAIALTTNGTQWVKIAAGTASIGTLGANSGVIIGDVRSRALVAHDAVDSGNPFKMGAKATNNLEGVTQVSNADRTNLHADLNGVLITRNGTTLEELLSERVENTTGTSTDFTTFAAGGAGIHNYITAISVTNTHASTNGYVDFRNGSGGAAVWTVPAPASAGAVLRFDPPLKFADNTAVAFDVSAAITTVIICVSGYQAQG